MHFLCKSLLINLTACKSKGAKDETMYYILNYQHTKIPTPTVSGIGIKLMFWDTWHKKNDWWILIFGKMRFMLGEFIFPLKIVLFLSSRYYLQTHFPDSAVSLFFIAFCPIMQHYLWKRDSSKEWMFSSDENGYSKILLWKQYFGTNT